jgi:hypothetical protein
MRTDKARPTCYQIPLTHLELLLVAKIARLDPYSFLAFTQRKDSTIGTRTHIKAVRIALVLCEL